MPVSPFDSWQCAKALIGQTLVLVTTFQYQVSKLKTGHLVRRSSDQQQIPNAYSSVLTPFLASPAVAAANG